MKSSMTSTTASRRLQNLLKAFPTITLLKLVNAVIIIAFRSSLELHRFLLVSHSITPLTHIIIKGVRQQDV